MSRLFALTLLALPALTLAAPVVTDDLGGGTSLAHPDTELPNTPSSTTSARIINGSDATVDDYPETGMLILDGRMTLFGQSQDIRTAVCSSTLIAPDVVLLAAHCLDEDALTGGFGTVEEATYYWSRQADLSALDGSNPNAALPADIILVRDYVIHQGFDLQSLQIGLAENHDIALLFLDVAVFEVEHAYLPTLEESSAIDLDLDVTVVGWGQQTATDPFVTPPAGTIYIKKQGVTHIAEVSAYEMKIGDLQTDVRKCHGDSGGPTFLEMQDTDQPVTRRVIGVTSHAYDQTDCFETGGVDTRVDYYLDWIDDEMRSRCEDATRAWCEDEDEYGVLPPPIEAKGCGCTSAPVPSSLGVTGLGLLALVGVRRRR